MGSIEEKCLRKYYETGDTYHLVTPENFELIFEDEADYCAGINALAFAVKSSPDIVVYTFQIMSNHLHLVGAGKEECLMAMFDLFCKLLKRYFDKNGRHIHWSGFKCRLISSKSLENLRNDIAYTNRNGFVVHPDVTPFSYKWGANRFYFNPEAVTRYRELCSAMTVREKRELSHSRKYDSIEGLKMMDGYVSPLSFCAIEEGEAFFRDARQYFNRVAKSIESYKDVADRIGEFIYYTDDDLFAVARNIVKEKYGGVKLALLPGKAKLEMARTLHYDYNASKKQIQRMLRLEEGILLSLFPSCTH